MKIETWQGPISSPDPRIETAKRALARVSDMLTEALMMPGTQSGWQRVADARELAQDAAWAMVPEKDDAAA